MVTGQQSLDFDLSTAENSNLITLWGMNWIATKMPDGHWLTEARLHGAKVVTIAPEYQSSTCKADRHLTIRTATDSALALGMAQAIIRDGTFDAGFVKTQTDLSLLVRTDTRKLLRAADVIPGYVNATLRTVQLVDAGEKVAQPAGQDRQIVPRDLREEWRGAQHGVVVGALDAEGQRQLLAGQVAHVGRRLDGRGSPGLRRRQAAPGCGLHARAGVDRDLGAG